MTISDRIIELTREVDYETACENCQELANLINRQAYLICAGSGIWYAIGRKEYYAHNPSNPRERRNIVATAYDPIKIQKETA